MKIEQIPPGLMLTDFICEIDDCFEDAEYFYSNRSTSSDAANVWRLCEIHSEEYKEREEGR